MIIMTTSSTLNVTYILIIIPLLLMYDYIYHNLKFFLIKSTYIYYILLNDSLTILF